MQEDIKEQLKFGVIGHCKIQDDLGNVLLDKKNAIHPQNMARIIARALANEPNGCIYRIAYGNGGSTTNLLSEITLKNPNVGTGTSDVWDSRLYNETYSEIVDDGMYALNTDLGVDPGSADVYTGIRAGGGSVPTSDPVSVIHTSGPGVRSSEVGLISEVLIRAVINANEPNGDVNKDGPVYNIDSAFAFDEIGLYTGGTTAIATNGHQYIDVGTKVSTDNSGLTTNTLYNLVLSVDGGMDQTISFLTPGSGSGTMGEILYGDLCEGLNTGAWGATLPSGVVVSMTDTSNNWATIVDARTYGKLKISSPTVGETSSVLINQTSSSAFLQSLQTYVQTEAPVQGSNAGYRNSPTQYTKERERLLTHLTFTPIIKDPARTLTVSYTITITVTAPSA